MNKEEISHFDIINKWLSIRYIDSKNSDLNSEHLLRIPPLYAKNGENRSFSYFGIISVQKRPELSDF